MKKIPSRVLTALIGIPIVAALIYLGGPIFFIVAFALALVALRELEAACLKAGTPIDPILSYALLIWLMLRGWHHNSDQVALWPLPVALCLWAVFWYPAQARPTLQSIALTLLAVSYTSLFLYIPLLRLRPTHGFILMWLTILGVWTGDTAAYYAGRRFGKTKLTQLSPGKTLEGALAGGIATVAVCAWITHAGHLGLGQGIALGVLIAIAAPLGDLVESFWKRELGVKDLGTLLPGHGGVLDRCDSLLFACALVYGVTRGWG